MPTLTLSFGVVLVLTGVVAYLVTDAASATALIPSLVGVLLVVAGVLALRPPLRRHAIHAALAVALVAALGSLMNVVRIGDLVAGTAERPGAIIASTIMFVLLAVYLLAGVRSFVAARRWRQEESAAS